MIPVKYVKWIRLSISAVNTSYIAYTGNAITPWRWAYVD